MEQVPPRSPREAAPGLLNPLVKGVGMLGKLLAQLVVLLLPALFFLEFQFAFLKEEKNHRKLLMAPLGNVVQPSARNDEPMWSQLRKELMVGSNLLPEV